MTARRNHAAGLAAVQPIFLPLGTCAVPKPRRRASRRPRPAPEGKPSWTPIPLALTSTLRAYSVRAGRKVLRRRAHDIQILMAVGKLTPLGDPVPNAAKWFAAVEMIRLAADINWLHKATKEIAKYWRHKRERRQCPMPASRSLSIANP